MKNFQLQIKSKKKVLEKKEKKISNMCFQYERFLSNLKKKRRKGRGPSSTNGHSCGRGSNGQNSRAGKAVVFGFEGGQFSLYKKMSKKGHIIKYNRKRKKYFMTIQMLYKMFKNNCMEKVLKYKKMKIINSSSSFYKNIDEKIFEQFKKEIKLLLNENKNKFIFSSSLCEIIKK